jgi:hypothetical protein
MCVPDRSIQKSGDWEAQRRDSTTQRDDLGPRVDTEYGAPDAVVTLEFGEPLTYLKITS